MCIREKDNQEHGIIDLQWTVVTLQFYFNHIFELEINKPLWKDFVM